MKSLKQDKLITFEEYVNAMPEGQKEIYYATGKSKEAVLALPQMDLVKSKDYDVLLLSDDVDEFMIQVLKDYNEKAFKSVNNDDLNLVDEEEAKKIDELKEEKKDFLTAVKNSIPGVKDVVLSKKLKDAPCCVTADGGLTFEMERVLRAQNNKEVKAERIFELNPNHPVFTKLEALKVADEDSFKKYTNILYNEALLQEGILPDDPKAFADILNELILK